MKNRFHTGVVVLSLAIGWLTGCDKKNPPQIETSGEVITLTESIHHLINNALKNNPHSTIAEALRQMPSWSLCAVSTEVSHEGVTESTLYCESWDRGEERRRVVWVIWPIKIPTTLDPQKRLTTIGVELKDISLETKTGCGILEDGYKDTVYVSPQDGCLEVNNNAASLVERYERLIDTIMLRARDPEGR